ncbi:MAG: RraA family protein [Neptuniibacter sp.]
MFEVNSNTDWPPGFMINKMPRQISVEWLKSFSGIPSSIISDCLGRNVGALGLKPYHGFRMMCGSAVTVRVRPGDNLMILKALEMVRPNDVLVIDGGADTSRAVVGGIMRAIALKTNLAGFVINGAIRDRDEWAEGNMPVYALDCVHRGPSSDSSGEINVPVSCAGLVVNPGDLVIGDADGVVAVCPTELDSLYDRCKVLLEREKNILYAIENNTLPNARFDEVLRKKGCPI